MKPGKAPKAPKQGGGYFARQKPGFLTHPVSGRQALKEVKAATRLEYQPTERAIQGDIAGSQQRQRDIPGWFQNYQNTLQNGANQTAAAYSQAQQQLSDRMNQAGALDQSNRADMQQRAQADATLRGVSVDNSGSQDSANIAAARQSSQARLGGTTALLGANQSAYLSDKQRIGAGEQINQSLKEQTRERGFRSDLRTLGKQEGDFATKYLADLRESERRYALGKSTIKGENTRAQLSSNTTKRGQNISAQTSRLNAQLSAATSRGNAQLAASIRQKIARLEQKGQKQRNVADNRQSNINSQRSARNSGKGKGKGKK